MSLEVQIQKLDEEQQIVYGEVYVPNVPDSQGDYMVSDEIRRMAHRFMQKGELRKIDREHDNQAVSAYVAESFVARKNDPDFIEGSWVVGVHVTDKAVWEDIKKGEINGFSMQARAVRTPRIIEIEVPSEVEGDTDLSSGHRHRFFVKFDENGQFAGGRTDEVDGHRHRIEKGTTTEDAAGHSHRYSFAEAFSE